jgi:hypothetical protein
LLDFFDRRIKRRGGLHQLWVNTHLDITLFNFPEYVALLSSLVFRFLLVLNTFGATTAQSPQARRFGYRFGPCAVERRCVK